MVTTVDRAETDAIDLCAYIAASPTPYHAVAETIRRLEAQGYRRVDEVGAWKIAAGDKIYVVRGGTSIAAFEIGAGAPERAGFHLIGAHTDSPNLRVKPAPELTARGYEQLGVEVYGGVLLSTWLDRDLSLAGRVLLATGADGARARPVLCDFGRPIARVPNLAIHLNREVNTLGLVLNAQLHMVPIVGLDSGGALELRKILAEELSRSGASVDAGDVVAWDLAFYDAQPPSRAGLRGELIHAGRLDNLASCHAATRALLATSGARARTRGIVLYDHEEVGSRSAQGAASPFLRAMMERIALSHPETKGGADVVARAIASSFLVSADMAHAIHPNYPDRHEPTHAPILGRGPVIKSNVNQAYATDGESAARFEAYCRACDVTPQRFVTRTDLPCGSTIGPIVATELGLRAVDVGNPMLSMHSAREMAAVADVPKAIDVMAAFFMDDAA